MKYGVIPQVAEDKQSCAGCGRPTYYGIGVAMPMAHVHINLCAPCAEQVFIELVALVELTGQGDPALARKER